MNPDRLHELATNLAESIAGKQPEDAINIARTFIELAVKEAEERTVTVTMAQTIIDCATHANNDSQMAKAMACDAGLLPLKSEDKSVLKQGLGSERFSRFIRLCGKGEQP